jgi:hypothetical protein
MDEVGKIIKNSSYCTTVKQPFSATTQTTQNLSGVVPTLFRDEDGKPHRFRACPDLSRHLLGGMFFIGGWVEKLVELFLKNKQ